VITTMDPLLNIETMIRAGILQRHFGPPEAGEVYLLICDQQGAIEIFKPCFEIEDTDHATTQ
jgi:hypothetical protein